MGPRRAEVQVVTCLALTAVLYCTIFAQRAILLVCAVVLGHNVMIHVFA